MDITDNSNMATLPRLASEQLKMYRTRRILLILLGILFISDLINLIITIYAYFDNSWISHYFKSNYELLWTVISIVYYTFGILVTYRYNKTGLRLFAWIGTTCLVLLCIVTGIILFAASKNTKQVAVTDVDIIGPAIFILMFVISSILLLIIVLLAFKLSKLIIDHRDTTTLSI